MYSYGNISSHISLEAQSLLLTPEYKDIHVYIALQKQNDGNTHIRECFISRCGRARMCPETDGDTYFRIISVYYQKNKRGKSNLSPSAAV